MEARHIEYGENDMDDTADAVKVQFRAIRYLWRAGLLGLVFMLGVAYALVKAETPLPVLRLDPDAYMMIQICIYIVLFTGIISVNAIPRILPGPREMSEKAVAVNVHMKFLMPLVSLIAYDVLGLIMLLFTGSFMHCCIVLAVILAALVHRSPDEAAYVAAIRDALNQIPRQESDGSHA